MSKAKHVAEALRRWREHPAQFVREVFGVEPDAWQLDVLEAFPHQQRMAMACCKGPGKTTCLAWLIWNFLLTRSHPKIAATAITADNLADNLWAELAKWQKRSEMLLGLFEWQKTRIFSKEHPETWWASARTWPRSADAARQGETLAGLHADNLLFVIDEAGGVPMAVGVAADAGLANIGAGNEGHLVLAGNPTSLDGLLYDAVVRNRRLWHVTEVSAAPDDPKRTPRVSVEWAQQQIDMHGADNPFVLVNVFGRFPPSSIDSLIGVDEVRDAMKRHYQEAAFAHSAKILGVDVAREGDDCSVIFSRQGSLTWKPIVLRNVDGPTGAARVAHRMRDWGADGVFVDGTGGFGSSWIDFLRTMGIGPVGVHFSAEPTDRNYFNKRTEMYFSIRNWIREGGALPDCPELLGELASTSYGFRGDRMLLEPKDLVKKKLGRSPDHGDALALTFAYPVVGRAAGRLLAREQRWLQHRPEDEDPRVRLLRGDDAYV